jgi:hypothetical protein
LSPRSPSSVKVASGGLEKQDDYASRARRRRAQERTRKREMKGRCLGEGGEWCEAYGTLWAGLNRPGGRERWCPHRGHGMAVMRSPLISSARDGSCGMGSRCRWWGDVGATLALQGDYGKSWEQWQHEVTGRDFLRPLLVGRGKEGRAWARDARGDARHGLARAHE